MTTSAWLSSCLIQVPDYYEVIEEPMDLSTMMLKVDSHDYQCVAQFLADIDLTAANALEYNPWNKDLSSKVVRHHACDLKDAAYALIEVELDLEFEKKCLMAIENRRERGPDPEDLRVMPPVPSYSDAKVKPQHQYSTRSQGSPADQYLTSDSINPRGQSSSSSKRTSSSYASILRHPKAAAIVRKYSKARRLKRSPHMSPVDCETTDNTPSDSVDVDTDTEQTISSNESTVASSSHSEPVAAVVEKVTLSRDGMRQVLDAIVHQTHGFAVPQLDLVHCRIKTVLDGYAGTADRTHLVQDLKTLTKEIQSKMFVM